MKLIFMGTPEFAVTQLKALIDAGHDILAVYTQPPRPSGRGQKEQKSPVHTEAEKHNITVKIPTSLKNEAIQAEFKAFGADMAVISAYGLIIPKAIIDSCPCLNVHASLLPRWRGAAPIQRTILAGDQKSGVTIMMIDEGLDSGDMLIWDEVAIDKMTAGELHDNLSEMGARLIVDAVGRFDELKPVKQGEGVTYADKIQKDEALIDWNKNANEVERQIRAFNPFPGAYFNYNGEKFKILTADLADGKGAAGMVLDDKLAIACGQGAIRPKIIQRQGKKAMSVEELLRGYRIDAGSVISG